MNYKKSILVLALCGFVLCGFFYARGRDISTIDSHASSYSGITSESIKDKETQIDQAQKEKDELQANLSDIKKMKEELEKAKSNLANYVIELDKNLASIESKISELNTLIEDKEKSIEETETQLNDALQTESIQYEAMKSRIKFMYEMGDTFYLETLLSATSFSELLNKADYVEQVSEYDRKMLDQYVLNRQMIELCKEQLEEEKALLDEAKEVQVAEQNNLAELIGEKENQIVAYQSDIKNKDAAIKEYEEDIAAQNQVIQQLEAAVAEERKRLIEENGIVLTYDGGMFTWPAPSYTRISSEYGNRMHPTLGVEKFHNGLDMASPSGTKILAAYSGTVVASDYNGSMGNYIMIDHGDSLYTIYMHASALYVSKGDVVAKGQHIAAVGSTGRSTGPHLHFGVRLNGSYVSPWSYLTS